MNDVLFDKLIGTVYLCLVFGWVLLEITASK